MWEASAALGVGQTYPEFPGYFSPRNPSLETTLEMVIFHPPEILAVFIAHVWQEEAYWQGDICRLCTHIIDQHIWTRFGLVLLHKYKTLSSKARGASDLPRGTVTTYR